MKGEDGGFSGRLPLTILLVPLMVYESKSFLPGLVFAMRVCGVSLYELCFLRKGLRWRVGKCEGLGVSAMNFF